MDKNYVVDTVCIDCMYFMEGYEVENPDWDKDTAEENLSPMGAVTSLYYDEDGINDFSYSMCYGCGTTLGGARYDFAVWENDDVA